MSKLIEALLNTDKAKLIEKETATIELKRLTDITGTPFVVTVQAISNKKFKDIQSRSNTVDKKGNVKMDLALHSDLILLAGIVDPDLRNKDLLNNFGCLSANELIEKLFNVGEVTQMTDIILSISGITADDEGEAEEIEEIKKQ